MVAISHACCPVVHPVFVLNYNSCMTQPTTSALEGARALFAEAAGDSSSSQIAVGLIQLIMTAKRVGSSSNEQATVSAMLSKLALEGPMRSADLSAYLALDPSTVSRHICSMVDDALVTKTTDEHDRRVQWIALTFAGRELRLERVRTRTQDFARVTSTWSELERQSFGELLAKFVNDFDRTLNESEHV